MGFECRTSQNRFKIFRFQSVVWFDGIWHFVFVFLCFIRHRVNQIFFANSFQEPSVCNQIGGWEFKFFKTLEEISTKNMKFENDLEVILPSYSFISLMMRSSLIVCMIYATTSFTFFLSWIQIKNFYAWLQICIDVLVGISFSTRFQFLPNMANPRVNESYLR